MNIASDDSQIIRFYDDLFSKASNIVTHFHRHPPVVAALYASGAVPAVLAFNVSPEQRLSLLVALAGEPQARAAALVTGTRYEQTGNDLAEDRKLLQLLHHGVLATQPTGEDAILISILTATELAVMICEIDRMTNTVHKAPLVWMSRAAHLTLTRQHARSGVNILH